MAGGDRGCECGGRGGRVTAEVEARGRVGYESGNEVDALAGVEDGRSTRVMAELWMDHSVRNRGGGEGRAAGKGRVVGAGLVWE